MKRPAGRRHPTSPLRLSLDSVRFASPSRDTDATSFTSILDDLLASVPGAYACVLVDAQGESVDYAGRGDPFDVRVAGAYLQIAIEQVRRFALLGLPRWLVVRGTKVSAVVRALPEGYALAVLLRPRIGFSASERAFLACERALAKEAGWPAPREKQWHAIVVETDRRGRPVRIGQIEKQIDKDLLDVEVLGAIVGLPTGERGYRVRTARGAEFTVVRETSRHWYADESPASLVLDTIPPL